MPPVCTRRFCLDRHHDPGVRDSPESVLADPVMLTFKGCTHSAESKRDVANYYAASGVLGNRCRLVEKILLGRSSMDARNIYRVFIRRRSSMLSFMKHTSFLDVWTDFPRKQNTPLGKAGTGRALWYTSLAGLAGLSVSGTDRVGPGSDSQCTLWRFGLVPTDVLRTDIGEDMPGWPRGEYLPSLGVLPADMIV